MFVFLNVFIITKLKKTLIFLLLFFAINIANAQYYDLGQDPASTKWKVMKTENFKIIYPADFEANVQKLANTLQYVYEYGTRTLDHKPKRINVILHDKSVVANAYSLWTPQRTEFFTCPPQNTYAQDWLEQLATHEYRHMIQMDKLNQGFTKALSFVVGQHSTIAVLGLFVPMWYMEGDAVCTETALSHSGRGRIPSFEMKSRAQILEKGIYSFEKAQLGSSKNYVPDQYYFGYNFVSYSRKLWGAKAFQSAMDYTGKYPFMITPFNHGLKKVTGLSKQKMYNLIWDTLSVQWKQQQNEITYSKSVVVTKKPKIYTNFKFPRYLNDTTIIAEKSGKDDISRVVCLDKKGNEKTLFTPGFYTSESLSLATGMFPSEAKNSPGSYTTDNISISQGRVCWGERNIDPRWAQRDYSVIKIYDFTKDKVTQLTKKTRYFAPYFFPDGSKIVVSEVSIDNKYNLTVIDSKTGAEIKKIFTPDNQFLITPSVSSDGKYIICVALSDKGKSILKINVSTGEISIAMEASYHEISNPVAWKNYIFFNGDYSGIENIYAFDTLTKEILQVTSAKYGAIDINISPNAKKMAYADYTADGYCISETDFLPALWKPINEIKDNSLKVYKSYLTEEMGIVDKTTIQTKVYDSKKYSKLAHIVYPHSWTPFYLDIDNIKAKPGVSIMSQNLLSNTYGIVGWEYDKNTKQGKYHADITYKALYPVFTLTFEKGKSIGYTDDNIKFTYDLDNIKFGVSQPLSFIHGHFIRGLNAGVFTNYIFVNHNSSASSDFINGKVQTMEYRIFAYNQIKSVERDTRPRWGQSFELNYMNTPFGGNDFGSLFSAEASFLLPGFIRHHSLMIYTGYQDKAPGAFGFTDKVQYPKGYYDNNFNDVFSASFNYKMPLAYPDFNISSLLYFKKIVANIFYDYAKARKPGIVKEFNSVGADLLANVHVVRFFIPLYLGVRTAYMPAEEKVDFQFLFSVDFSGF
jgi:hypothetical protein